jgi:transposase
LIHFVRTAIPSVAYVMQLIHGGIAMNKKYVVRLTADERALLENLVSKGKAAAYKIKHANILLKVDIDGSGWSDEETAEAFGCHANTVRNVRQRLVEKSLETALERKKQQMPSRERILDGENEARLIAVSCSEPPSGSARWTLQLLADRVVEMEIVETVSATTVGRTLKKTNSSRICASVG